MVGVIKDLRKLCIMKLNENQSDQEIRDMCKKFGTLTGMNRTQCLRYAFPSYKTESEAASALVALRARGYVCDYANSKRSTEQEKSRDGNSSEFNMADEGSMDEMDKAAPNENSPHGSCLKCADKAYYVCSRCNDFYCSPDCQAADWLRHKKECFPMPKLVPCKSKKLSNEFVNTIKSSELNASINEDVFSIRSIVSCNKLSDSAQIISTSPQPFNSSESLDSLQMNYKINKPIQMQTDDKIETTDKQLNVVQSLRMKLRKGNDLKSTTILNNSMVYIVHITNYHDIYIRSTDTTEEYCELIETVHESAKTSESLTSAPKRDMHVLAPFDGLYYRAVVINVNEDDQTARVGFIDFGNTKNIPFKQLKQLNEEHMKHRRLILKVTLKNIDEPTTKNQIETIENELKLYMEDLIPLQVKCDTPTVSIKDAIELYDTKKKCSINELLNSKVRKHFVISDLQQMKINEPNPLLLCVNDNFIDKSVVLCILDKNIDEFLKYDEQLQEYGDLVENDAPYQPQINEMCIMKLIEQDEVAWYRIIYEQNLTQNQAQVFLIDYGRKVIINPQIVRAFTKELMYPIFMMAIYIEGLDGLSVNEKKGLINPRFKANNVEYVANEKRYKVTL